MIALGQVYYCRGGWYRQGKRGPYRVMAPEDASERWDGQYAPDERCGFCVSRVPHSREVHSHLYGATVRHYLSEASGGPGRW